MASRPTPALADLARQHLTALCSFLPDRRPGSVGNREATSYAADVLRRAGWDVATPEFDCVDWRTDGGSIQVGAETVSITPSPYGLGVAATGPVRVLRTAADLDRTDLEGSVVVLADALATEPLTPKAFPFYSSEEHSRTITALEVAAPAAVIAVTGMYPAMCGALDPFPLIEDGDFIIPTGNVRRADAASILQSDGEEAVVVIRSNRWAARAHNVIATRGPRAPRVTVIAHIDTKPGTPGAVDNAAGVVVLFLIAESMSQTSELPVGVELLAVNGEDHYGAPGELDWLAANEGRLDDVVLALNIDGAGYRGGRSAFSTYNLEPGLDRHVATELSCYPSLIRGPDFYQSDHAIFAMRGRPAMAITTEMVDEMLATLFHAPTDTPDQVDVDLLLDIAAAITGLITNWPETVPEAGPVR